MRASGSVPALRAALQAALCVARHLASLAVREVSRAPGASFTLLTGRRVRATFGRLPANGDLRPPSQSSQPVPVI